MQIYHLNAETCLFAFDELPDYMTYVASIIRNHTLYLIDTFLGPDSMKEIMTFLNQQFSFNRVIIINTHYHFDHIWGNCYFPDCTIIAHQKCKENMQKFFSEEYQKQQCLCQGQVSMRLPNRTFKHSILLEDDLLAFYSPGHTSDSISVYDLKNKVLFAGDNLEKPLLHIENDDLNAYLKTLENYQKLAPETITSGHTLLLDMKDVLQSIDYIKSLIFHTNLQLEESQKDIHQENIDFLLRDMK